MIKTKGIDIDSRTVLLLLIIAGITFLGGLFIMKVSTGVFFLIIAALIIAVASFLSAEVALYVLIISMLFSPEFVVGDIAGKAAIGRGITLRFDDILLVVIGFSWFLKTAVKKDLGLFLKTTLNRPIAAYFVICLIATLFGFMMGRVNGLTGFFFVLKYFEYFIVYFMVVNQLRDKRQIERFIMVMLIVCFIVCLVAIAQIPAGGRVTAPFEGAEGEPNTLGGYLILMLSITFGLMLTYGSKRQKGLFAILSFFIVVSLMATLSRSSWLAVGPMLLALIYFSKRKVVIIVPLIVISLLLPFVLPSGLGVKERALFTFTQPQERGQIEIGGLKIDTSTSARLKSWQNVLTRDFIKHPILGYGVTGYQFLDAQYPKVLVETGIVGFVFFMWLLAAIFKNALYAYRNTSDPLFSGLSLGYLAGFIAMLVHAIGANTFIIVRIMEPFWFLTAIIIMIPMIEGGEAGTDISVKG